jgi:hypothetical protein
MNKCRECRYDTGARQTSPQRCLDCVHCFVHDTFYPPRRRIECVYRDFESFNAVGDRYLLQCSDVRNGGDCEGYEKKHVNVLWVVEHIAGAFWPIVVCGFVILISRVLSN